VAHKFLELIPSPGQLDNCCTRMHECHCEFAAQWIDFPPDKPLNFLRTFVIEVLLLQSMLYFQDVFEQDEADFVT
jgi:hypothetical protein